METFKKSLERLTGNKWSQPPRVQTESAENVGQRPEDFSSGWDILDKESMKYDVRQARIL